MPEPLAVLLVGAVLVVAIALLLVLRRLRQHARRARELERALARERAWSDEVAAALGHDVRAPLRHVEGFGALLERKLPDGEDAKRLARIRQGAQRADAMLLAAAHYLRATPRDPKPSEVDLEAAVRSAVERARERLEKAGGRVEVAPLPRARADPDHVAGILDAILSNCVAFRSARPLVVTVSGERSGTACRVRIEDNGRGLEPDNAQHILGLFRRVDPPGEGSGHGVGLATARRLAEANGGSIRAEPAPGGGAAFIVELPAD